MEQLAELFNPRCGEGKLGLGIGDRFRAWGGCKMMGRVGFGGVWGETDSERIPARIDLHI